VKLDETQLTWKTHHAGRLWICISLFNVRLSEASWSRSSCHNPCSAWASTKWADGAPACSRSYSGRVAGLARDDEAPALSAGRPSAAPTSPLTTSAPVGGSGLMQAGSPTGPSPVAERRRLDSPPPPPAGCRQRRASATSTAQRPPRPWSPP
jgi:hypothetical protein